jgi:ATP-dependent DNA helicase DinG
VAKSGLVDIAGYLTPRARHDLASAIEEAEGNEVFFIGRPANVGRIDEIEVYCRGNSNSVPALRQIGRPGEVVIHNHPSGRLTPSEPDIELASHFGQEGVGFMIINNAADRIYVVVEPLRDTHKPVDGAAVADFLAGPEGLPALLEGYEARPGQLAMADAVTRAQNEGQVLVVEAGTGTGKSLAYLVPSAIRALQNEERVAVATRTRHLQGQLMDNDVPLLQRLRPDLKVAMLKGRGNYLCRRKLGDRLAVIGQSGSDEPDESQFLRDIAAWVETTTEGDRDDLPFVPDFRFWEGVASNSEHTRRARCPHFEECFYYRSRREAAGAHLLLVNHHLLLADRALRMEGVSGLLPRYEHIILDEAHHLEDVATDFAGRSVSGRGLLQQLGRICPTNGRRKGLGRRLRIAAENAGGDDESVNLVTAIDRMTDHTEALRITLKLYLEDISGLIEENSGNSDKSSGKRSLRIDGDLAQENPVLLMLIEDKVAELRKLLVQLGAQTEQVLAAHQDMPPTFSQSTLQLSLDLRTVRNRLLDGAGALGLLLEPNPEVVRWIDLAKDGQGQLHPRFHVRPVDVTAVLDDILFSGVGSVTLTSATLSVAGQFGHFQSRTGVGRKDSTKERFDSLLIESPFDYSTQVWLGIPSDLPEPGAPRHLASLIGAVAEAVRLADGRTFALFTSYRALRDTAAGVARILGSEFTILKQGDLPRERLLSLFRT